MSTTRDLLAVLDEHEAEQRLDSIKLTEAQFEYAKARLTADTGDAEQNKDNAHLWHAFKKQWADPDTRSFKFEDDMTPGEYATFCKEHGRSNDGAGFVIAENDITLLSNYANEQAGGDVNAPLPTFVREQINKANKEGRLLRAPRDGRGRPVGGDGFVGETDESRNARLIQLSNHMQAACGAKQRLGEIVGKLREMEAGKVEAPERRSYLHRQLDGLDKSAKSEQWDTLSISVDSLPEYKTLRSAGAALDAETVELERTPVVFQDNQRSGRS